MTNMHVKQYRIFYEKLDKEDVVEREYSMHASNWVLAGGIANANKISDATSKKHKTDDE